jgi:multidrug efflux pump subunit AcrA (membrane-fusion protein)
MEEFMDLLKLIHQSKLKIKKEWNKEPRSSKRTLTQTAKHFLILFFLAMFGFSFLSRAADSVMTAKVRITNPQSTKLSFKINGFGTVKEKDSTVLKLMQGLVVDKTFVIEGDVVKVGDSLFSYDMEELQKLYQQKEAALEKNKIEQKKLDLNNTESELKSAQIAEKYAQQSVEEANDNLDATRQSINDEIEKAYHAAKNEYDNAVKEKEDAIASAKEKLEEEKAKLKELEDMKNNQNALDSATDLSENENNTITDKQIQEAKDAVETLKENLSSVKDTWKETVAAAKNSFKEAEENWEAVINGSYDYTTGLSGANSALTQAQKSLEEAQLSVDSATENQSNENQSTALTAKGLQLDIDLASKEVLELKGLIEADGIVYATEDGTVISMGLKAGAAISGTEVVSLAVNGISLEIKIEKEEAKKLTVGDVMQVKIGEEKDAMEGVLKSIGTDEKDGMIICDVAIPEGGNYIIGSEASFEWSKQSRQYDTCIPINALREDGYQQTYVLVIRSKESVLGNELQAFRLDVTVLDKDTTNAAIEGAIAYEDQVIIGSNKEIAVGDRVRVDDNE